MKDQERSNVANPPDYQFQHADTEPHTEPQRSLGPLIAAAVLVMLAAAGAYWMFGRHRATAPATPTPPPPTAVAIEPARPLGADAAPVDVPPLGESDAVVRTLVRALSTHPVVAAWLTTTGLIRNFTAAVSNIADDSTPAKQLVALRPAAVFTITSRGGKSYIDPQSYSRYNRVADALASVDPAGAARLYTTLKPRIEEAAGELGHPPGTFDRVLERAIVALLRTPIPEPPIEVIPYAEGIGYGFVDDRLEALSPSQKALVRMGPRNAAIVKARLREIALALGIPPGRLPHA